MSDDTKIPNKFKMVGGQTVKKLKEHLQAEGLEPDNELEFTDDPRPSIDQPNVVICCKCGEPEYRSRTNCRCTAYLRGQVEDEYLKWRTDWEAELDALSTSATQKANVIFLALLVFGFIVLSAHTLGLTSGLLSKVPPYFYLFLLFSFGGLMKLVQHFETKSQMLLAEKQLLTFELYNEFVERQSADRTADNG